MSAPRPRLCMGSAVASSGGGEGWDAFGPGQVAVAGSSGGGLAPVGVRAQERKHGPLQPSAGPIWKPDRASWQCANLNDNKGQAWWTPHLDGWWLALQQLR